MSADRPDVTRPGSLHRVVSCDGIGAIVGPSGLTDTVEPPQDARIEASPISIRGIVSRIGEILQSLIKIDPLRFKGGDPGLCGIKGETVRLGLSLALLVDGGDPLRPLLVLPTDDGRRDLRAPFGALGYDVPGDRGPDRDHRDQGDRDPPSDAVDQGPDRHHFTAPFALSETRA